ncbi:DNA topoisomerase [Pseudomonas savastanoi]|uniref:DNA topoisomerase n=1 Tax=Pseudomonas savastanoi TaxID=29438 RepID=UPI000E32BA4B|nr:DNA topoisomerase [Pseudomonas savastanoi]
MGKTLIITEKSTVAATIAKAIGGFSRVENWLESEDAILAPAAGHLVEIHSEEMAKAGRDISNLPVIPDQFELRLIEEKKKFYQVLDRLMRRSDVTAIANACDAGREGELIFRLIYKRAGCTKPMLRLWMTSTTDEAIQSAYAGMRPGADYDNLAEAAEIRSEGDFIVGINASRGITRLYERQTAKAETFPLGRVQTPTLSLVCALELSILTFRPVPYWEVHATFGVSAGNYVGKWLAPRTADIAGTGKDNYPHRILNRAMADAIIAACSGAVPTSVEEDVKPAQKGAGKLYDLTGLQREANRKLGFSAAYTLELAQKLYLDLGLTTYPRTDSAYLPDDFVNEAKKLMSTFGGSPYEEHAQRVLDAGWVKPNKKIFDSKKVSDHYAIVPTGKRPGELTEDLHKIYDMIVRRFLAVFHPAAEYSVTVRLTTVENEVFRTTGRVLVSPGWMQVYGPGAADDADDREGDAEDKKELVPYVNGEHVSAAGLELKMLKTKPPQRYTEDTLLGAMETAGRLIDDEEQREAMKDRGLGTPVTRSAMIESLLAAKDGSNRKKDPYMVRDKKYLAPSAKGMTVYRFLLENNIQALTSPILTGEWEQKLRLMEKGQYSRTTFKQELSELTIQILDTIKEKYAGITVKVLNAPCPTCGGAVEIQAKTFACAGQCGFSIWREIAKRTLKVSEAETLLTQKLVVGLKGFVSTNSGKKFEAGLRLLDDGKLEFYFDPTANTKDSKGNVVTCPKCQGPMRRIKTATGHFWGCSDRDECKHTMNDRNGDPIERPMAHECPECGKPMYLRNADKSPFWGCSGFVKGGGGCNNTLKDNNGTPVPKSPPSPVPAPSQPDQPSKSTPPVASEVFL